MIHIDAQPEPASFDTKVRQRGLKFLADHGIDSSKPLPPKTSISPCWRYCLDELYDSYSGTCAYLAIRFQRMTGAGSVDHYVEKSPKPSLAYEWSNYRLACSRMNTCKREYDDVLDPFKLADGWFHLELVSGRIFANPSLTTQEVTSVAATISRLGLDEPGNRKIRVEHWSDFIEQEISSSYLRKISPFVWMEANRQGLL